MYQRIKVERAKRLVRLNMNLYPEKARVVRVGNLHFQIDQHVMFNRLIDNRS
jgi:hypothetical protein